MTTKRVLAKHNFQVDHISNPHLSGGGIKTENLSYLSGYYLDDLMEIGEAEIIFPNSWIKAGSKNILLRNLFNKYDLIQIWRDKEVSFTGLISDDMELSFSQIKVKLKSNIFLLTQQYTGIESYTEEPATTVKRFLKGYDYIFKDNFNRTSIGDNWTSDGYWDITNNALRHNTTGSHKIYNNTVLSAADTQNSVFECDIYIQAASEIVSMYFSSPTTGSGIVLQIIEMATSYSSWFFFESLSLHENLAWRIPRGEGWHHLKISFSTSGSTLTYAIYLDSVKIMSGSFSYTWQDNRYFVIKTSSSLLGVKFDNIQYKKKAQLIAEGTINNYGSSVTTTVSYETLYNAIHQRIKTQLASTDSLATMWEWQENHLAFDPNNPTNPRASLDFKERIGMNKDVILSVGQKNIAEAKTRFSFSQFKTNLIALGAGTTAAENEGQPVYEVSDFDSYDEVGMILQTLYQLSDETDYSRLSTLASLWLGKYKDVQENIEVDPIDYENKGFSVGDGYIIDIPELLTDKSTYYRIMSEKREFSPDGAEKITVNWKYKKRSFLREVEKLYRESLNKARYNQGTYINISYTRADADETVAAGAFSIHNNDIDFQSPIIGVKKIVWQFYHQGTTAPWSLWIDSVDRTNEIWGSATVTDSKWNVDLTRYMTAVGTGHVLQLKNEADYAVGVNNWGVCEVWVR